MDIDMTAAVDRALELGEIGFQIAVYEGEDLVVDVCAGYVDEEHTREVDGRTIFPVFSVTKAVTAVALNVQVERGLVEYDVPIAQYWPEFAANGKAGITVRHVLTHQSGLPQMPSSVTWERLADWEWMVAEFATMAPLFEAGTTSSYQAMNFGWLLGEVIRRTDLQQRMLGDFIRDEICVPLGMDDFWVGLPAEEEGRVAVLSRGGTPVEVFPPEADLHTAAIPEAVAVTPELYNSRQMHRAHMGAGSGIMSANSSARLFAMLANHGELNGTRLLSEERVLSFTAPRPGTGTFAVDRVIGVPPYVGAGGLWLAGSLGMGPGILVHEGYGGSIAMADLDTGIALAICHNRMFPSIGLPADRHPWVGVIDAICAARPDLQVVSTRSAA